jgi:hypothetical protein
MLNIIDDINNIGSDFVKIRVNDFYTEEGTLPLNKMQLFLDSVIEIFKATANSTIEKKKHFTNMPQNAKKFLEKNIRFGQTERGSFVVTIITDFKKESSENSEPEDVEKLDIFEKVTIPYEREVLLNLAKNIQASKEVAKEFIEVKNEKVIFDSVDKGLSSNFFSGLNELSEKVSAETIEFSFSWSPLVPNIPDAPKKVELEPTYKDIYKEAADLLKEDKKESELISIEGFVYGMIRPEEKEEGEVFVKDKYTKKNIHLYLDDKLNEYNQAVQAHQDKNFISCEGELTKSGNKNVLQNITGFKTVETEANKIKNMKENQHKIFDDK